ncbi:hypothetical protein M758_UG223100 [Ceratodon purpureus]|nr:hypothetical protein M758_UG223100 [Ceratodon purpureus]
MMVSQRMQTQRQKSCTREMKYHVGPWKNKHLTTTVVVQHDELLVVETMHWSRCRGRSLNHGCCCWSLSEYYYDLSSRNLMHCRRRLRVRRPQCI